MGTLISLKGEKGRLFFKTFKFILSGSVRGKGVGERHGAAGMTKTAP